MAKAKVDLTMLKRLLGELEATLNGVEQMRSDIPANKMELVVEISKATGLSAGIMQEAGLLIADIYSLLDEASPPGKSDFLEKLLGGLKGPGSTN